MTEIDFSKYRVKTICKKEPFSTNDKTRMSRVYGFTDYREIERIPGVCLFFDENGNLLRSDHSGLSDNIRSIVRTNHFTGQIAATRDYLDEIYKITVIYVDDYSERIALVNRINDTLHPKYSKNEQRRKPTNMADKEMKEESKKNKIVGYTAQDDGGPGGKGYAITQENWDNAREIYKEIFGYYPDETDVKKKK